MKNKFSDLANQIGVSLKKEQIENFLKYKELLLEWNKKINLTAITDDYEIILKHFIDSLTVEKYIKKDTSIIDVGTGAGFPGIPLKIVREDIDVTLLDSLNKRLLFLEEIIKENKLKNIRCVHGRAEDFGKNIIYREKYDVVVARAVANTASLSELCLPFVKIDGIFICMKGDKIEELDNAQNAIKKLGGAIEKIDKFVLPETDIERNIIIIKKIKHTPKEYPRKAGMPVKSPII